MRAVIDTSVASMIFKANNGQAIEPFYANHLAGRTLVISFQTVEEMLFGARKRGWGDARVAQLDSFLKQYVIVPGHEQVAAASARIRAEAEALGRQLLTADAWIVATAITLDVPLITDDQDQVIAGLNGYSFVSRHVPLQHPAGRRAVASKPA